MKGWWGKGGKERRDASFILIENPIFVLVVILEGNHKWLSLCKEQLTISLAWIPLPLRNTPQ